jgi:hypothetical protein
LQMAVCPSLHLFGQRLSPFTYFDAIALSDYHNSLVFRSAVESIRGTFIASSTVGREDLVGEVLNKLEQRNQIAGYEQNKGARRFDFTVAIERNPDYFAALEVKGGEGNSINISDRPLWAREFAVWSHLDGAIVNQPAHGAHAIINRLTNDMVRRDKHVDTLFIKDALCGSPARPCPKYPISRPQHEVAPDVFLFPQRTPSLEDPDPPLHTLQTLKLPNLVLSSFNLSAEEFAQHIWQVRVLLIQLDNGKLVREIQVVHQTEVVDQSRSRPWNP